MTQWRWVTRAVVFAVHDRQIAEHGGLAGIRDLAAIESALARPLNLAGYGDPDLAALGAAYMYGLARNYGFADGNKRTAWVIGRLFIADHGATLRFERLEAIRTVEALAAGTLSEAALADWIRSRLG